MQTFPVGAAVLIDGKRKARVLAAFPAGSTSYAFPHYRLREQGQSVVVAMSRVGVTPKL